MKNIKWSEPTSALFSTKYFIQGDTPIGMFEIRTDMFMVKLNNVFIHNFDNMDDAKDYCEKYLIDTFNKLYDYVFPFKVKQQIEDDLDTDL